MLDITTRSMTSTEFNSVRERLVREYAAEKVAAGEWMPETAERQASEETDRLLPQGVNSPGVLMLMAETPEGESVGYIWLALERHPGAGGGAWIYNIEIWPEHRARGYGRSLLTAAEIETADHGVETIGLNVFGGNSIARNLYESAGYEVSAMQMSKQVGKGQRLVAATDDSPRNR
jgi:ribosomal protein S18 acetylase RimI-like enzyme